MILQLIGLGIPWGPVLCCGPLIIFVPVVLACLVTFLLLAMWRWNGRRLLTLGYKVRKMINRDAWSIDPPHINL